jgi:ectoine hydroxylase-related dioxygenase (phytanoyl-CoA dioxygenase family)
MGTAHLERFDIDVSPDLLITTLERDGCAIVEGLLDPAQLAALNRDLDDEIAAKPPGVRAWELANRPPEPDLTLELDGNIAGLNDLSTEALDQFAREFYGSHTVRIDGLAGRSPAFVEVMCHPVLLAAADRLLLPNCSHYLLNTGQLIEIRPGEEQQMLHRDEAAWSFFVEGKPELTVESMIALSDFSEANGATRVAPGSHRWDAERKPHETELATAAMPAGSAIVYLGSTLHGGGANHTEAEVRRGLFLGYVLGWLRTEENSYLTTPIEAVRGMPHRAQKLLGYEAHQAIGVVDVGTPMKVLDGTE